ncbi:DUF4399 domain-containing protein [Microbulbifer halophilus]|uniref:DUF4399 domain-containing protein n=1 Tax=Microbulbifer halophilus TaxID=453963 RepID=A0ABW5ECU5_9GAMM|nr:DUF4399 domain-containing protein [Microbulbifer halophilus]MCW8128097.1 DUF4399 domain-containing protein [Microbulbifer halophilus]
MNGYKSLALASALLFAPFLHAAEDEAAKLISEAPADAEVYIISPKDGETVGKTFKIQFGLSGMGVAPAGVDREGAGHHHLLIDMDEMPDMTKPLPASDQLIHFGGGQTETEVTLPPGKHTLQLVLGNYLHIPFKKPVVSDKITVTVE